MTTLLHDQDDPRVAIWHLTNMSGRPAIGVWPMDDRNFRVNIVGDYPPVLSNPT